LLAVESSPLRLAEEIDGPNAARAVVEGAGHAVGVNPEPSLLMLARAPKSFSTEGMCLITVLSESIVFCPVPVQDASTKTEFTRAEAKGCVTASLFGGITVKKAGMKRLVLMPLRQPDVRERFGRLREWLKGKPLRPLPSQETPEGLLAELARKKAMTANMKRVALLYAAGSVVLPVIAAFIALVAGALFMPQRAGALVAGVLSLGLVLPWGLAGMWAVGRSLQSSMKNLGPNAGCMVAIMYGPAAFVPMLAGAIASAGVCFLLGLYAAIASLVGFRVDVEAFISDMQKPV